MEILQSLDVIIQDLSEVYVFPLDIGDHLDDSQIVDHLSCFDFPIPNEVYSIYSWHNGISDNRIFGLFYLMSIEECFASFKEYIVDLPEEIKRWSEEYGFDPSELSSSNYLPLFSDGGGGLIVLACGDSNQDHFLVRVTEEFPMKIYSSLNSLFRSVLEAHREGAFFVADPNSRAIEVDFEKWAAIARRNNPGVAYWE